MASLSWTKRLLFVFLLVLIPYLLVEATATTYGWFAWWGTSFLLLEDTKKTIQFDPVLGYRVTGIPARTARITNGQVESVGLLRGNNQGLAGWYDFGPKRQNGFRRRIAVFGDSFTDAHFLGQNWPDRARELTAETGEPIEFLNFAQTGAGLANWWSILTKVVAAEDYEIDGVIFAVWETDLLRRFTFRVQPEPGAAAKMLLGRCPSWDPRAFPATLAEARPFLEEEDRHLVTPVEFEQALQGHWPPSVPRPFRLALLSRVWERARSRFARPPARQLPPMEGRDRLIADIGRYLQAKQLPALVVHLPMRENLLAGQAAASPHFADAQRFAADLAARFLDASQIFAGMSRNEIRAHFLPYDGHWNQKGSDRFAHFLVENLNLLEARPGH
jgi:hypothetical protein